MFTCGWHLLPAALEPLMSRSGCRENNPTTHTELLVHHEGECLVTYVPFMIASGCRSCMLLQATFLPVRASMHRMFCNRCMIQECPAIPSPVHQQTNINIELAVLHPRLVCLACSDSCITPQAMSSPALMHTKLAPACVSQATIYKNRYKYK